MRSRRVDDNAAQPRRKGRAPLELVKAAVRQQQRVLYGILGIFPVAEDAMCYAVKHGRVPRSDRLELAVWLAAPVAR
jgi:hypothetical protein